MKAKILTTLSFLLGIVLISGITVAQPVITTAASVTACPGSTVAVPITVASFADVASISLTLNYDVTALTFTTYTKNSAIGAGFEITNATGGQVKSAYFGMSPVNLTNGATLYTYNFNYLSGSCPLIWDVATNGNCQYSNLAGDVIASDWIDGSITPAHLAPVVSANPSNLTVNSGAAASFSTTVANATNYQWQVSFNNGTSWSDVTNGGVYSGATTATLAISSASFAMNTYQYRCHVSENVCNQASNTTAGILTVDQVTTSIEVSAGNITACPGTSVLLPVNGTNVNGFNNFTLTLDFNAAVVSYISVLNLNPALASGSINETVNGSSLTISFQSPTVINLGAGKLFDVNFNYLSGSGIFNWSAAAGMSVFINTNTGLLNSSFSGGSISFSSAAPVVTLSPGNQSITENTTAHFNITAIGAANYQWQVSTDNGVSWINVSNNTNYSGATTASLTINNTALSFNGNKYRCVAKETNCNQAATSASGSLTVNAATSGITISIGNLSACPDNQVVYPITATNFNDIFSMSLAINYDPTSLTYVTHQNDNVDLAGGGFWQINNPGNQFLLAWFSMTPANLGSMTITEMVFQVVNPATINNSEINFDTVTPGLCAVSDLIGNDYPATFVSGTFSISGGFPIITTQPMNTGSSAGGTVMFMAEAQGSNTYLWQEKTTTGNWTTLNNNGTYSGVTTGMLTISNVAQPMDGNQYRCVVTGGVCNQSINSSTASLQVFAAGTIITTAGYINTCPGGVVTVPITVNNFADVASVSLKLSYDVNSLTYTGYQNPNPAINSGFLQINATGGQVALAWFNISPVTIANGGLLVEFLFNYVQNFSLLTWDPTPGNCLYSNAGGATLPSVYFNGAVISAGPMITLNPVNVSLNSGLNATYQVTATNATAFHWQVNTGSSWVNLTNTSMYSGVLSNTLQINTVTTSMDGYQYRCVVTGICGNSNTTPALLHVISVNPIVTTAPTITHCPGNLTIPITVNDFQNVGSFNLRLTYTSAILSYNSNNSPNSSLTGTLSVTNGIGYVDISYTGSAPITIPNGSVLLNIVLNGSAGTTPLTWDITSLNACKYQTVNNTNLASSYVNGSVTVNALPGFPGTISGVASMCQGSSLTNVYTTNGSTNALSYEWSISPASAGNIVGTGVSCTVTWTPSFVGSATVIVKGVNGCGNGSPNGKGVTINPLPITSLSPFSLWCSTSPAAALTGGTPAGGTYSGNGVANNIFDPIVAGIGAFPITYTITNSYGCTKSASQILTVNQSPTVTLVLNPSVVSPAYVPYILTGGSPAGGTYSGVNVNSSTSVFIPSWLFTPTGGGNGFATITYHFQSTAGCTDSVSVQLPIDPTVGIQSISNNASLSVNPNPSNGMFKVNLSSINENIELFIMNNLGQIIYQEKISSQTSAYSNDIDLTKQPKGIYHLRVVGSQIVKEEKIVIQ